MHNRKRRDLLSTIDQVLTIVVAVLAILFVFADLLFDFLHSVNPNRFQSISDFLPKLTLFVLGYLLISLAIERRKRFDTMQSTLDEVLHSYSVGAQYLEDMESVGTALEKLARSADECIMALGSRSQNSTYLANIENAVIGRNVLYYRLIDSSEITHELHIHLKKVIVDANVQVAWTPKEKFGNLTVSDKDCVIAFPAPYKNQLSGLHLPGETNSRRYSQFFLEAFSKGITLKTEKGIEALCEKCSPNVSGNSTKVQEILIDELQKFMENQSGIRRDLQ
ncbi:MAG TPA: hypothetical protein VK206_04210 [Anaerolineales bacterium]|nr:hypothetical protein [Anaerolineales bacterium]